MGSKPSKGEEKILVKPSVKKPIEPTPKPKEIIDIKVEEVEDVENVSLSKETTKELETSVDLEQDLKNQVNFYFALRNLVIKY